MRRSSDYEASHTATLSRTRNAPRRPRTTALPWIAGVAVLAVLVVWHGTEAEPQRSAPPPAPDLWPSGVTACDASGPAAAQRATQLAREADAKAERLPFAPVDGIRAVVLYRRARACFRAAENHDSATRADRKGRELARRIAHRYRAARIRLRLALEQGDAGEVSEAARTLQRLLQGRDGAYARWLEAHLRRIPVELR